MTRETARQAVMMLADLWREVPQSEPARITFFGGEPLLNRDVIEHTIHFAREWGRETGVPFRFSMSTNATLLRDEDVDLFVREQVLVQVSIDGPEPLHDRHRRSRGGGGTFTAAMAGAQRLLARQPGQTIVRATAAAGTCEYADIVRFLADAGFRRISIRAMEDNTRSTAGLDRTDLAHLEAGVDLAVRAILEAWRREVRCDPFDEHLRALTTGRPRTFVCSAGNGALCVDTGGEVYPCHRFVGQPAYRIGTVSGSLDRALCERFASLEAAADPSCGSCWAVKFCWGMCPGESAAHGLVPGQPHTESCGARQVEALMALKCAAARGLASRTGVRSP